MRPERRPRGRDGGGEGTSLLLFPAILAITLKILGVLGAKPPEVSFHDIPVHRSPPFLRRAIIFLRAPVQGVHGVDAHRHDVRGERRGISARSRLHLRGSRGRCFRDRLEERPLLFLLLHPLLDDIAVVPQFADQGIDLL